MSRGDSGRLGLLCRPSSRTIRPGPFPEVVSVAFLHGLSEDSMRVLKRCRTCLIAGTLSGLVCGPVASQSGVSNGEWPTWGGDDGSTRYSSLAGIHAGNVDGLEIAWRWKMDNHGP